jgi:hypothetical protein
VRLIFALILGAILFASYSASLYAPFVYDDLHFVIGNPSVTFQKPISLHSPRPLTLTTFRINYLFGQDSPLGYHLVNVAIHAVNAALVFFLLLPMIGEFSAFLACGIFALHPLQSEAVTYISGRSELLMTLFVLLALISAERSLCAWPEHETLWRVITGFWCLFAILSKESGIVSIPLVIGYLWMEGRLSRKVITACFIGFGALATLLYAASDLIPSGRSWFENALLQNVQLWQYLAMLVYPAGLSIDHDPASIGFALQILAAMATLSVSAWALSLRREAMTGQSPLYACGLGQSATHFFLFVAIALLPRFIANIPETLAEHHTYLPMVGLSALLALAINFLIEFSFKGEFHVHSHSK